MAMKIAVVGLGSIAKRHILNLSSILENRAVDFEIDVFRHSNRPIDDAAVLAKIHSVYTDTDLSNNDCEYDIAFITNPTSLHYETIKKWVTHAKHMFIEKPVFEYVNENVLELGLKSDSVYYVACPLRYTLVLQYIKSNIDFSKVYSVRAISSSYLPDWRPGIDYRKTYSASKNMGGGVAIDLIHEWDYLTHFLGTPEKTLYVGGKYSHLEIDSDDLATYIGIYKDKIVELHLDYFGRQTLRECTFFMNDETVVADLTNGYVRFLKSGKTIELKEERNRYQIRELEHFLEIVEGKVLNDSSVYHAVEVLKIAKNYKG